MEDSKMEEKFIEAKRRFKNIKQLKADIKKRIIHVLSENMSSGDIEELDYFQFEYPQDIYFKKDEQEYVVNIQQLPYTKEEEAEYHLKSINKKFNYKFNKGKIDKPLKLILIVCIDEETKPFQNKEFDNIKLIIINREDVEDFDLESELIK